MKNINTKTEYVLPSIEIIRFDSEDVITTSSANVYLLDDVIWEEGEEE